MKVEEVSAARLPVRSETNGEINGDGESSKVLLWLQLHLRGKYLALILLAVLLGGGLGYLGFQLGHPTYRSLGQLQVVKPQTILWKLEDDVGNDTQAYVAGQVALLESQRLIEFAMQDPEWVALRRPVSDATTDAFRQSLKVIPIAQMIQVTFDDPNPKAAYIGVKAVVSAYQELYIKSANLRNKDRLQRLRDRETGFSNEEGTLTAQIDVIEKKYGTEDIGGIYLSKRQACDRLQDLLEELKTRLKLAPPKPDAALGAEGGDMTALLDRLEVEQLGQQDATLRNLLTERENLERQLRNLKDVSRYGEEHPQVMAARRGLASVENDIDARAERVRTALKKIRPTGMTSSTLNVAELRQKVESIANAVTEAKADVVETGKENLALRKAIRDREEAHRNFQETHRRYEILAFEGGTSVEVVGLGTMPSSSLSDTRIRFAAVGAVGGMLLSLGLVLLPSVTNRRFRAADETRMGSQFAPVLGILPELPSESSDDENTAMAAHCVHQTRTLLQMRHSGDRGQVLAVTSSLSGTGKTSLTLALGVSFATSGSRTLLIDCDLVGGGLTARTSRMLRRKLGRILVRDGLLSAEQLKIALERSVVEGRRLGETCIELGYLQEQVVQQVLEAQEQEHVGLLDALSGETLLDCVAETAIPGLSVMPLGSAGARHCASLSPQGLRRLLERARDKFDVVLVDTGPIPGSLEASSVVPQVDGVVLVVSRGEPHAAVNKTTTYLREIGASPIGLVFNRASSDDLVRSGSHYRRSSAAFGSSSGLGLQVNAERSLRSERLGPMARAVADCTPSVERDPV